MGRGVHAPRRSARPWARGPRRPGPRGRPGPGGQGAGRAVRRGPGDRHRCRARDRRPRGPSRTPRRRRAGGLHAARACRLDRRAPRPERRRPGRAARRLLAAASDERSGGVDGALRTGGQARPRPGPYAPGSGLRRPLPGPDTAADVAAALAGADVAVVVLGGSSRRTYDDGFEDNGAVSGPAPDTTNGEGVDLASVAIPEAQLAVLRAARDAGLPVVAVVVDGRPRVLTAVTALADAVLVVPFPGPAGGAAVVDVLLGAPAEGRLPATWPAADGTWPVAHDERLETARGYVDVAEPSLPLGLPGPGAGVQVGLGDVRGALTASSLLGGAVVTVPVVVTNESGHDRRVAVPLWSRRREPGVRPRRRRVLALVTLDVQAGATVRGEYVLGLDALGTWGDDLRLGARPLDVLCWTEDVTTPPDSARLVRVTDDDGRIPWVS
ncbi:glycoside hydrolase family 3 protein [Curtobacterium sp. Curtsp57]|uniref:glycoside hydrolase family 3 protein n=1 Tax=Curtobacterium sp. Curtsp57 TaxID=3243047 RepID=UPI0039B5E0BE